MSKIVFYLLVFTSLFSIQETIYSTKSTEYIEFLKKRTSSTILSLNGSDWKYKFADSNSWETVTVPNAFTKNTRATFRKTIFISENLKTKTNIFHIAGLSNTAIIRINGEVLASYHYVGAPFKFILDNSKLFFGQENTIEIELEHSLNYNSSFPRKIISVQPTHFGGIFKDLYIESKSADAISEIELNRETKSVSFKLDAIEEDSIRHYNYRVAYLIQTLDLDTLLNTSLFVSSKRVNKDKITSDFSRTFRRAQKDQLNQHLYITTTLTLLRNKNEFVQEPITTFREYEKERSALKIISKVEQFSNGVIPTLSEIENDVDKIIDAGFNAIYFPYDSPHPYYFDLALKHNLKLFAGVPTYSLTNSQMKLSQTSTFIENYLTKTSINTNITYVIDNISHNEANQLIASKYNTASITNSVLNFNNQKIPMFSPVNGQHGNLDGYFTNYSEEFQAKKLRDFLKENTNKPFLVSYFNDFTTPVTDITQANLGNSNLSQTGLVNLNRQEKKSFRVIKALLTSQQELAFNPGIKIIKEEYSFITLGIIILAILVIGLRQAVRVTDTIKRALFHAHGMFTDTRDRRTLYMGQTVFIMLVLTLIAGNILAVFIYYNREIPLFTTLTNYLLEYETASGLLNIFTHPVYVQLWSIVIVFAVFVGLSILTKLPKFMRKNNPRYRQNLTVAVWSLVPVLFLWPLSTVYYNALNTDLPIDYIHYYLGFVVTWALLRWINGARVINDIGHLKVYFYSIFMVSLLGMGTWSALVYFKNIDSYIDFFMLLAQAR